jgi:hypothetical protein
MDDDDKFFTCIVIGARMGGYEKNKTFALVDKKTPQIFIFEQKPTSHMEQECCLFYQRKRTINRKTPIPRSMSRQHDNVFSCCVCRTSTKRVCNGCLLIAYCSKNCEMRHFFIHRHHCSILKHISLSILRPSVGIVLHKSFLSTAPPPIPRSASITANTWCQEEEEQTVEQCGDPLAHTKKHGGDIEIAKHLSRMALFDKRSARSLMAILETQDRSNIPSTTIDTGLEKKHKRSSYDLFSGKPAFVCINMNGDVWIVPVERTAYKKLKIANIKWPNTNMVVPFPNTIAICSNDGLSLVVVTPDAVYHNTYQTITPVVFSSIRRPFVTDHHFAINNKGQINIFQRPEKGSIGVPNPIVWNHVGGSFSQPQTQGSRFVIAGKMSMTIIDPTTIPIIGRTANFVVDNSFSTTICATTSNVIDYTGFRVLGDNCLANPVGDEVFVAYQKGAVESKTKNTADFQVSKCTLKDFYLHPPISSCCQQKTPSTYVCGIFFVEAETLLLYPTPLTAPPMQKTAGENIITPAVFPLMFHRIEPSLPLQYHEVFPNVVAILNGMFESTIAKKEKVVLWITRNKQQNNIKFSVTKFNEAYHPREFYPL